MKLPGDTWIMPAVSSYLPYYKKKGHPKVARFFLCGRDLHRVIDGVFDIFCVIVVSVFGNFALAHDDLQ